MVRRVAVTFLRHGLTEENKQKKYIGYSNPSLCEEGRSELEEIHNNLEFPGFNTILTSDRKRCLETAEILFPKRPVESSSLLREMHFGEWEGKTYDDLCHIQRYRNWIDDPANTSPPGGEIYQDFEKRLLNAWSSLIWSKATEKGHVAVVTHGGPIRFYLSQFAPSQKEEWAWQTSHGQGYTLYWDKTEGRLDKRCTLLQVAPFMEKQNGYNSNTQPRG